MKISELPQEVREKALEHQRNETDCYFSKSTDNLVKAFPWSNTKEGGAYWADWDLKKMSKNNGGQTDYYDLPKESTSIQDLIEHREMNFSIGNIFKACYRFGKQSHSNEIRDLNKIIYFANRELNILNKKTSQ